MERAEVTVSMSMDLKTEDAQKKAKKTGDSIGKRMSGALSQAGKIFKNFGNEAGGFGLIGNVIKSKAMLAVGAIALLTKATKDYFNMMFKTDAEKIKFIDAELANNSTKKQMSNDDYATAQNYLKELSQINKMEGVNNNTKEQIITIVEALKRKYGDLGIAINKTTGEIENLAEAEIRLKAIQDRSNNQFDKRQLALTERKINLSSDSLIDNGTLYSQVGLSLFSKLPQFFGFNKSSGLQELQGRFSAMSLPQKQDYLQERLKTASTETEIKNISQLLSMVYDAIKQREKLTSINPKDNRNRAGIDAETEKQIALQDQREEMRKRNAYAGLTNDFDRMKFLQKEYSDTQQAIENLEKANAEIKDNDFDEELVYAIEMRNKYLEEYNNADNDKDKANSKTFVDYWNAKIAELQGELLKVAKNETQIEQIKNRQLEIQNEINKLQEKSNRFYQQTKEDLQVELKAEKLRLQGRFEEANMLKFLNDLKRQGIIKDQEEIKKIMQLKNEMGKLSIDKALSQQGESLIDRLMPKNKQREFQRRLKALQQQTGKTLSDEQKNTLRKLIDYEAKLNNPLRFGDLSIKTNELTARGGFQGGAWAPNAMQINKSIANYANQQVNLLREIKTTIGKTGVI